MELGRTEGNQYNFESWFHLADGVGQRPDYGYYGRERIAAIQKMLEAKNFTTRYEQRASVSGVPLNHVTMTRDGQQYEFWFGFDSRQVEEQHIRNLVDQERRRNPNEVSYSEKYDLPKIQEGLKQDLISMRAIPHMLDISPSQNSSGAYDKEQEFTTFLQRYAGVYEDVTNIIYQEAGVEPPARTIVFRPPIVNQDTVAQVASTEVDRPTHVVESQITQERISFDDIAGQEEAVAEAKRLVLAINHPEIFERRGVKRPKGVLFYGPPGTGKTMLAKAVASEANAAFLEVSAADIGTKWYGESERLMQKVFDLANEAVTKGQKVVLYFDEIDALAPPRQGAHEATQKVVATMLQNMDGMRSNPNVTIIASTNRPQDIDPALRRPGRFDKLILVGLPSADGREKILNVHMKKAQKRASAGGELFASDIKFADLVDGTQGMSGADLANLVNLALEDKTMAELEGKPWVPVTTYDLISTAKRLGILKEEKRNMGFSMPSNGNGNQVANKNS